MPVHFNLGFVNSAGLGDKSRCSHKINGPRNHFASTKSRGSADTGIVAVTVQKSVVLPKVWKKGRRLPRASCLVVDFLASFTRPLLPIRLAIFRVKHMSTS